jgi:hypothetical protein
MNRAAGALKKCVGRCARLPTSGRNSYFWGGVLVVLGVLAPLFFALVFFALVFLVPCFEVFLAFVGAAVLFWSDAGWLWVAGAVACAKVSGRVAAAKTIASKLFFMLISPLRDSFVPSIPSCATAVFYTIDSKG